MPVRLLREAILDSEAVDMLSFPAEVFYRRLMSAVDDFGRFDARPSILRSRLYPLRIDTVREADISRWIAECEKAGLIALYAVDRRHYLLFRKLGSPRAQKSKFPAPPPGLEDSPATDCDRERLRSDEPGGEQTSAVENICLQTLSDESNGKQSQTGAPYSGSDSYSIKSPLPPVGGPVPSDPPKEPPKRPPREAKPPDADPRSVPVPPELDAPEFLAAWAAWVAEGKVRKGKKLTAVAARLQLEDLKELADARTAAECVRKSLSSNWTGIFTEKYRKRAGAVATGPPTDPAEVARRTAERLAKLDGPPAKPLTLRSQTHEDARREPTRPDDEIPGSDPPG